MAATIKLIRPDLINQMIAVKDAPAISDTPPTNFFGKHGDTIEGVGEPMNASFFTNSQISPEGWYYVPLRKCVLNCASSGGCLRNMMEFEDSGIP